MVVSIPSFIKCFYLLTLTEDAGSSSLPFITVPERLAGSLTTQGSVEDSATGLEILG